MGNSRAQATRGRRALTSLLPNAATSRALGSNDTTVPTSSHASGRVPPIPSFSVYRDSPPQHESPQDKGLGRETLDRIIEELPNFEGDLQGLVLQMTREVGRYLACTRLLPLIQDRHGAKLMEALNPMIWVKEGSIQTMVEGLTRDLRSSLEPGIRSLPTDPATLGHVDNGNDTSGSLDQSDAYTPVVLPGRSQPSSDAGQTMELHSSNDHPAPHHDLDISLDHIDDFQMDMSEPENLETDLGQNHGSEEPHTGGNSGDSDGNSSEEEDGPGLERVKSLSPVRCKKNKPVKKKTGHRQSTGQSSSKRKSSATKKSLVPYTWRFDPTKTAFGDEEYIRGLPGNVPPTLKGRDEFAKQNKFLLHLNDHIRYVQKRFFVSFGILTRVHSTAPAQAILSRLLTEWDEHWKVINDAESRFLSTNGRKSEDWINNCLDLESHQFCRLFRPTCNSIHEAARRSAKRDRSDDDEDSNESTDDDISVSSDDSDDDIDALEDEDDNSSSSDEAGLDEKSEVDSDVESEDELLLPPTSNRRQSSRSAAGPKGHRLTKKSKVRK